jgi:hypothetical protein
MLYIQVGSAPAGIIETKRRRIVRRHRRLMNRLLWPTVSAADQRHAILLAEIPTASTIIASCRIIVRLWRAPHQNPEIVRSPANGGAPYWPNGLPSILLRLSSAFVQTTADKFADYGGEVCGEAVFMENTKVFLFACIWGSNYIQLKQPTS